MNRISVRLTPSALHWALEVMDGDVPVRHACSGIRHCRSRLVWLTPEAAASWWQFCDATSGAFYDNGEYARAASMARSAASAAAALAAAGYRFDGMHWNVQPASDIEVLSQLAGQVD